VRARSFKLLPVASIACLAAMTAACGDLTMRDRSSAIVIIDALQAASGAEDNPTFSGTLQSDVVTVVNNVTTVFADSGRVTMRVIGKDPTDVLNLGSSITFNRYLVTFRRSDGRNTPGIDVPFPFDSAVTFTVTPGSSSTTASFELIRHTAKLEAPLLGLRNSTSVMATVADITFFGRDQGGREVSATGSIGIQFGNFADPD
jgi:hypothetical protein